MTDSPLRTALRFAHALGVNLIPTSLARVPQVEGWSRYAHQAAPRIDEATLGRWVRREVADLAARRTERVAWALLPGSGRYAVLDVDDPALVPRLLRVHGDTPLVVTSPNVGRAHLWYRWPDLPGMCLASRGSVLGPGSYDLKAERATIHAPGSLHHSGRGRYVASLRPDEVVPGLRDRLPEIDLAAIASDYEEAHPPVDLDSHFGDRWSKDGEGERRLAAYLEAIGPVGKGRRQQTLFRVCSKAGDLGLPLPAARPLVLAWAALCEPPIPADDARGALARSYQSRRSPIGCDIVDADTMTWPDEPASEDRTDQT